MPSGFLSSQPIPLEEPVQLVLKFLLPVRIVLKRAPDGLGDVINLVPLADSSSPNASSHTFG